MIGRQRTAVTVIGAICLVFAATSGCAEPHPTARAADAKLANPAARRCVDDGYKLEPVRRDGVPVDHDCVEPKTGRRCEVWSYFRGECRLVEK